MIPVLKLAPIVTSFPHQNIREKYLEPSKEIKQNSTRLENFKIWFYIIFDCYYQKFISRREAGH